MRDLVVREALAAMARDGAKLFRELIAAGEEIPYEVHEPGSGSPLCQYEPLTERFVRDHAGALRELDSFGAACAALEAAELAGAYLEQMGVAVPDEPRRRAELAAIAFLCRLWMGSADFSLDAARLDAAIAELERGGEVADGELEVVVPLRGLQMPISRLELPMATIVCADAVDVPPEARAAEGLGRSPWEPSFLAVAAIPVPEAGEEDLPPGAGAVAAFRSLITTLRLFKPGGVALGPHAWIRASAPVALQASDAAARITARHPWLAGAPGDRWRRIATGAGKPRPGGYRLADTELGALAAFARSLTRPSTPFMRPARPLARAISRFEGGLERNVVIEALNDHLLALRFVLEGGGPAQLSLSMRVAALCAEPERRDELRAVVERAVGLERELWSGEPPAGGSATPAETAARLEELARAILKDAACGHLGSDLRTTADEILLADGLAVGDGSGEQRGATEEWAVGALDEEIEPEPRTGDQGVSDPKEESVVERSERIAAQVGDEETVAYDVIAEIDADAGLGGGPETREDVPLDSAGAGSADSTNPVLRLIEQTRAERRAHHDRVANLFPAPETTEWNVREIAYDRRRRARAT